MSVARGPPVDGLPLSATVLCAAGKRATYVCRAEPATYAAIVRQAHELREAGIEHAEALDQALGHWGR